MSTYTPEQQEQLATLKAWWKESGRLLLVGVGIALMLVAAWSGWNGYQRSQAAQAGAIYEQLLLAVRASDAKAVRDTSGAILEQYPRTPYAALAALLSAHSHFQSGDLKTAAAQLKWASENSRSDQVKAVARLRLATVLLDQNMLDEALQAVDGTPPEGFQPLFDSMRGDILVAQKKLPEARAAYRAVLGDAADAAKADADQRDAGLREVVRLKLDALGDS